MFVNKKSKKVDLKYVLYGLCLVVGIKLYAYLRIKHPQKFITRKE